MPDNTVQDFYNNELERIKEKQKNATSILNSQQRLAELNNSYRKRYAKYVQILMVLIFAYLFYLGIILLQKMFPVIPQILVDVVMVVLIVLVGIYLVVTSLELYSRSVMNYDELDMPTYDASGVNVSGSSEDENANKDKAATADCKNKECCGVGTVYKDGICVPISQSPAAKEVFTTLDTAYTTPASFNSPMLKREPNAQNVQPLQDETHLVYSQF